MRYHISEPVYFTLEIKKSQFITWLVPVSDRKEAMAWLAKSKTQYPDARHHCWAYVLGDSPNSQSAAMSDDGEPSGTAGKPMLNVLQHKPVNNVMAIVIRYFGGIKLGAGGLVRAYSQAIEQTFQLAQLEEVIPKTHVQVTLPFADEQWLRHQCQQINAELIDIIYTEHVVVELSLPTNELPSLESALNARSFYFKVHD